MGNIGGTFFVQRRFPKPPPRNSNTCGNRHFRSRKMTIPATARSPCGRVREGLLARRASPNFSALNQNLHQPMSPETETILIVRPGALGDTILSLPLLVSIQSEHPDARITFLGNPTYQDLLPPGTDFQSIDSSRWVWLFGSSAGGRSRSDLQPRVRHPEQSR